MNEQSTKDARVLVLGGGFVGTAVTEQLREAGLRVRVATRSPLPHHGPDAVRLDWAHPESLRSVLSDVDAVLHTVATTVPATAERDPVRHVEENVLGSVRLLEVLAQAGVRRVVFVSSGGALFSHAGAHDEREPPSPVGLYGLSKVHIEDYLRWYARRHRMSVAILRATNIYGPTPVRRPQGVVAHLMAAAASGGTFEVWGQGRGRKDYLYLDDFARAAVRALTDPSLEGTFHVASQQRASVLELHALVESISGRVVPIRHVPAAEFDVPEVVLDDRRFRDASGWAPEVTLRDGLTRVWRWWMSRA